MHFDIVWSSNAEKELRKLERIIAKRIFRFVGRLESNPERWLTRLVNSQFYRLRVGDYRIIVDINFEKKQIDVLDLGHRRNIYD